MKTFPINLQLNQCRIVIFGGGKVAEEKIRKLLPFQPNIHLISPEITDFLSDIITKKKMHYSNDMYKPQYLEDCNLVIAATNATSINQKIYEDAKKKNILVNVVDVPHLCDFIMPAVISSDSFTIGISTHGKAAGYSRQIREELEAYIEAEGEIVDIVESIRAFLKTKYNTAEERKALLMEILKTLE